MPCRWTLWSVLTHQVRTELYFFKMYHYISIKLTGQMCTKTVLIKIQIVPFLSIMEVRQKQKVVYLRVRGCSLLFVCRSVELPSRSIWTGAVHLQTGGAS